MKRKLCLYGIGLLILGACTDVSTGVRSPCFDAASEQVTRNFNFLEVAPDARRSGDGGGHGCVFEDL